MRFWPERLIRANVSSKSFVAELAPKPDVPPRIRKRPERKTKPQTSNASSSASSTRSKKAEHRVAPNAPVVPERPPKVEPLSPARFKVEFTASAELHDKLKRLEALIPGRDLASIIDVAVSEKLERLRSQAFR